jgi:hypothetical protein
MAVTQGSKSQYQVQQSLSAFFWKFTWNSKLEIFSWKCPVFHQKPDLQHQINNSAFDRTKNHSLTYDILTLKLTSLI